MQNEIRGYRKCKNTWSAPAKQVLRSQGNELKLPLRKEMRSVSHCRSVKRRLTPAKAASPDNAQKLGRKFKMNDYALNYLYNGACREMLKTYPDNFFDCCVSDVPYKIKTGGARVVTEENINKFERYPQGILNRLVTTSDRLKSKWLKQKDNFNAEDAALLVAKGKLFEYCSIKFEEWLPEVYRVMKSGTHIYFMVNGRNFKDLQIEAEKAGFIYQNTLVWVKQNATPNHYYMQKCEFILMLRKGSARDINNIGTVNVFCDLNPFKNKFHPTEKPVSLIKKLIENSTKINDIVLEPFAGSGTTLIAAKEAGRNYVGSEIDKKYYDIALKRLNNTAKRVETQQKGLF